MVRGGSMHAGPGVACVYYESWYLQYSYSTTASLGSCRSQPTSAAHSAHPNAQYSVQDSVQDSAGLSRCADGGLGS